LKIKLIHIALFLSGSVAFIACNTTKKLAEGEKLYLGRKIKLEQTDKVNFKQEILNSLAEVNRPKPNEKIGGMRIGLWANQKVQDSSAKFLAKWINKKIGEKEVLLEDVNINSVEKLINNRLENLGYYNNKINHRVIENKNTALIQYDVKVANRLIISDVKYERIGKNEFDSLITLFLREEKPIKANSPFSLQKLKNTRDEVSYYLRSNGYYYFTADNLIFEADTLNTSLPHHANLKLSVKKSVSELALIPYKIDDIKIYPNYSLNSNDSSQLNDTTSIEGIEFIQSHNFFRADRMHPYLFMKEGESYNPLNERWTNKRLNQLKTYRFINIRYQEDSVIENGIGNLDASIYLSPLSKRSFRSELQAVSKSNNFVGPSLNFEYLNRNLFKGGEALRLSSKVGYEAQINRGNISTGLNSIETGVAAELIVPRLISLFPLKDRFIYSVPSTKFKLSYDLLNRSQWFNLNSFLAVYGFEWSPNLYITHNLNPISINYIDVGNESSAFLNLLSANPFLARSFEQQFIPGLTYNFQLNQLIDNKRSSRFYFAFGADFSGNTLALIQNLGGVKGDNKRFWGQSYAQFSRFDFDLRHYQNIGEKSRLVSRIFTGLGLPYGNSVSLPYAKQYFAGGPNSVRAFPIRSLGPGNYQPSNTTDGTSFFDQAGDIKIEANIEYRFPLISYLKGAVFTDAGNVWLRNDDNRNGQISSNWINEMAIGSGLGLRLDIEFFVIRLDVAAQIRKPTPTGFEWQDSFQLENKSWRQENINWNFGIGYPF